MSKNAEIFLSDQRDNKEQLYFWAQHPNNSIFQVTNSKTNLNLNLP
jgi:hypothetical protein